MFVLGIDPGLTRCGYGLVRRATVPGAPFFAEAAGVLETRAEDPAEHRLGQLAVDLEQLISEYQPEVVVVERIFFQANVTTAVSVAQVSGVALASATRKGIDARQYSPNEVKQAVVGHGGATKSQVQAMVAHLCGLRQPPSPPDVADALAVALCHLTAQRFGAAVAAAKPS